VIKNLVVLLLPVLLVSVVLGSWLQVEPMPGPSWVPSSATVAKIKPIVEGINREFVAEWKRAGVEPTPVASELVLVRRLSLALMGTIPSLQELRELEKQPESERQIWWLAHLLTDRRFGDYMAERLARVYVGVEDGPFLIYRRRRFVSWLSDQLMANVPYDQWARALVQAEGIWTTQPEANFITVTAQQNNPDEIRLAGRFTRAFLGMRIDCMQCHDDQLGDRWKQTDFHHLASFFAGTEMTLTGVRDKTTEYKVKLNKHHEEDVIEAKVPFAMELYPDLGSDRTRLAQWLTHKENPAFARAFVNRMWALMFGEPLVEPVDHIPLEGPYPPALQTLAADFVEHHFDVRRLIALIALSQPFQLQSRAGADEQEVSLAHYLNHAAFPLTRLRPEQVAGSLLQAASLKAIDADTHIVMRIIKYLQGDEFVKRYGDAGADEFGVHGGTIPQRLLLMNGNLVSERTDDNLVLNAAAQLAVSTSDAKKAIEAAYLALLTRRPNEVEAEHFFSILDHSNGKQRMRAFQDLYWSLLNSTEFSWNH